MSKDLIRAARDGDRARVESLLDAGLHPDASNDNGFTALMLAAREGHLDVVQLLLERGANPSARTRTGYTPLNQAAGSEIVAPRGSNPARSDAGRVLSRSHVNSVSGKEQMTDHSIWGDPLHHAVQNGDVQQVQQLLSEGVPVDLFDEIGKTPLHYAAEAGHLQFIRLLLEAGADVNAHDERLAGNTPLAEVAGNCSYEVARLLIEAGADPTIPGWMQLSALDRAQQRKRPEGLQVLQLLENAVKTPHPSNHRT